MGVVGGMGRCGYWELRWGMVGGMGVVGDSDIPRYFEEALEGKSIPLFGSSPHSLAKDSLGLSFSPFKRGWLARRAI